MRSMSKKTRRRRTAFRTARTISLLLTTLATPLAGHATNYALGNPGVPVLRDTTSETQNDWLSKNPVLPTVASYLLPGETVPTSVSEIAGLPHVCLEKAAGGFIIENAKPDYYLGEQLLPPTGVDWPKTYNHWLTDEQEREHFLFDNLGERVYVIKNGVAPFKWILADGSQVEPIYNLSPVSGTRPFRIFWTEEPYNAPPVNLAGKFVKLFGPDNLVQVRRGVLTNFVGGISQVISNNIVSGVHFDPATDLLRAYGHVEGQFVLVYYDSGTYERIRQVLTVEVGRPAVIEQRAEIGRPLHPAGSGYNAEGLTALPRAEHPTDKRGPYYYQHQGAHSYSPKNGIIYPLRDTSDFPWRLPVYWMEEDNFGTLWPFELCHYACSWPKDARNLIAGAKVPIPKAYSAELMAFQEPEGHAIAPNGNIFETKGSGYSLLRLTGDDNVWFIPVHSVERDDEAYFDLSRYLTWDVGKELLPREGGSVCHVKGYDPPVDREIPGHINMRVSCGNHNPKLYSDPLAVVDGEANPTNMAAIGSGETNEYSSVIYAVNTADRPIEVWWSGSEQQEGMAEKIPFPCSIERYEIVWPGLDMVPQIVLASGQGSLAPSVMRDGGCALFMTSNASLKISDRAFFGASGGSVSFWIREPNPEQPGTSGAVLSIGEISGPKLRVDRLPGRGWTTYTAFLQEGTPTGKVARISTRRIAQDEKWHKISISYTQNPFATADEVSMPMLTVYYDGVLVSIQSLSEPLDFSGISCGNAIGSFGPDRPASMGTMLDSVLFRNEASGTENQLSLYTKDTKDLPGATALVSFDQGWTEGDRDSAHYIIDEVQGVGDITQGILIEAPGMPRMTTAPLISEKTPVVYGQRDKNAPGFNPNEEHAFLLPGGNGYTVWALRCDLNTEETSRPFVLVEYTRDGKKGMQLYAVAATNAFHPELAGDMEVGTILPGPHPLDMVEDPWLPENTWDEDYSACVYRDRKKQLWCRAPGSFEIRMFYANQQGFDYPSLPENPPVGTPVPWLGYLDGDLPGADVLQRTPAPWTWRAAWPRQVPTMRIGQTLTKAAGGLPEVWNAKSVAIVYPDDFRISRFPMRDTILLHDPTIARHSGPAEKDGIETPVDLVKRMGFEVGPKGNASLRAGKYTFNDLPPSIGGRFYIDSNRYVTNCVTLIGELEEKTGGASILYPNVLLASEREAIKALVPKENPDKKIWDRIVSDFCKEPVEPTDSFLSLDKSTKELSSSYRPRDHYALTAMGGTGHVVLIENDAIEEELGVDPADPISMHVFSITNDYYTGRVVTRENPLNLLSEQLAVLYTESFAGKADDFIFEWRKAEPLSDGKVPLDFERGYVQKFPLDASSVGLTRFTVGEQGDTLVNMVNTYYAVRYRAAHEDSAAYASMGDKWSDWCGPTLAEGWVQRVLNNVTPFTQRMQDLYENAAETQLTMIEQAGPPYEGDIALNQDNLKNLGLIQLYQTVLNKAESMSLTLGIDHRDVNKQLQLAAGRLGDLYMVLGNEALSDALNPTIGFGSASSLKNALFPGYCGSYFSSLFCFDNQVPTLLDEELALLRGRTGANAPFVQTPPFYNRLIWNFTKGIHAGEVAYAVNYNVNSANGDAVLDEEDAARQFPQGHGDAYGHYLSALNGYYRLLRNPYFSWGPPAMGEMIVNDAVVNVDYYDEARFAEIADKAAETAALTTDRTARKAWRDNGGVAGAGYTGEGELRGFGYGEWATRGGVGAIVNWMTANSLLPEPPDAATTHYLVFEPESLAFLKKTPLYPAGPESWTFEVQFSGAKAVGTTGQLLNWDNGDHRAIVTLAPDRTVRMAIQRIDRVVVTNEVPAGGTGQPTYTEEKVAVDLYEAELGAMPTNALLAISAAAPGTPPSFRLLDVEAGKLVSSNTPPESLDLAGFIQGRPIIGKGFSARLSELRFWETVRSDGELLEASPLVSPRTETLLAYSRGISDASWNGELPDEVDDTYSWYLQRPQWPSSVGSGVNIAFTDKGLLRIDRTTAPALASLPRRVEEIQATLDRMDRGLNPLGLSQCAVPFDITPIGEGDERKGHFEQIAERARMALANASTVLDQVQEHSARLRMLENAAQSEEEAAELEEMAYDQKLIEIYGYPYADDIGPGGTYVQGYDGPDLYHFMWMDLEPFGLQETKSKNDVVITYQVPQWALSKFIVNYVEEVERKEFSWLVGANGVVKKPANIQGRRRATGKLQQAYADFLVAYAELETATDWYLRKKKIMDSEKVGSEVSLAIHQAELVARETIAIKNFFTQRALFAAKLALLQVESGAKIAGSGFDKVISATPKISGAGMTVNLDPQAIVDAALAPFSEGVRIGSESSKVALQTSILGLETDIWGTMVKSLLENAGNFSKQTQELRDRLLATVENEWAAAQDMRRAYANLIQAYDEVDALVAKGERLLSERENARAQRVNRLTKLRYNDMFFRQQRSTALERYDAAFALAQKYLFLAAQAYDYETAQLSTDRLAGDAFRAEIVGARTIGRIGENGEPLLADGIGEAGLSDILARMEADWMVLKPRLGINNPDRTTTWFSLRRELFRIDPSVKGDANWRTELEKHWVDDIRAIPEYRRYCQPFASSSGLELKEPGFVISFSSDIDFGENFFGRPLRADDSAYDSTYFSTKIADAGLRFVGYNEKINGYAGEETSLASTPVAYLLPLGADRMRVPGGGEQATILDYNVVDQVVPAPYRIGATTLDDPDWQPFYDGKTGGIDTAARIRRYPSFRVGTGNGAEPDHASTRLVGRSAWNSRWVMIIPAGAMAGGGAEARDAVRSLFLCGKDVDRDGIPDISGVRDIQLGLRTYSNSGN